MPADPAHDEFYYGKRQRVVYDHTGQPTHSFSPLQASDFLDPDVENDRFVHPAWHDQTVAWLWRALRHHHRYSPFLSVLTGVKLRWGIAGLSEPAPDLALADHLPDPERPRTALDVQAEGVTVDFVLEVTSPRYAELDRVDKLAIYAAAGVRELFVVDAAFAAGVGNDEVPGEVRLLAYRLAADGYAPIPPDASGRYLSEANRLWFGPAGEADSDPPLRLTDARTGRPVQPPDGDHESGRAAVDARLRARSIADQLGSLLAGNGDF